MPQKSKGREKPRDIASIRFYPHTTTRRPSSAMLASPTQAAQTGFSSSHASRPTLPSLAYLQAGSQLPLSPSSLSPTSYNGSGSHVAPSRYTSPIAPQTFFPFGESVTSPGSLTFRPGESEYHGHTPFSTAESASLPSHYHQAHNPLKRTYETSGSNLERAQYETVPFPVATAAGEVGDTRRYPRSSSASKTSTPTTSSHPIFGAISQPPTSAAHSTAPSSNPNMSRFRLHIRQEPRAARAGPDGKDRRPIDPPPILQLLMTDFNVNNENEVDELHSRYWVCHCRLVSAHSPRRDMSTLTGTAEDGTTKEIQRLLLGTTVASPFQTKDDPHPETMPLHPISAESSSDPMDTEPEDPPSPSSRFLARPSRAMAKAKAPTPQAPEPRAGSNSSHPATFFIFPDISVRKAGEYRLEFSLMHMEPISLSQPGFNVPILHNVASQVFRVVNAKDFDQVKASTALVRGLVERGAGFPLKLKKGTRQGQGEGGRRRGGEGAEGDEEDDDDDDDENEEDD